MKSSWKTTVCGLLAIIGASLVQFFSDIPLVVKCGGFLGAVASGAGLMFARDNKVTSEQATGHTSAPPVPLAGPLACLLAAGLICTGCATVSPTALQRIATTTKLAAYVGTSEYLTQHPEAADKFVLAANELDRLANATTFDWVDVMAVVHRLPVKELQSPRARLAITVATIVLEEYGAAPVSLDQLNQWRPVVAALRDGIRLGLD